MNVLFVTTEASPFIGESELANVAGELPAALRALGHDVRLVLPRYRRVRDTKPAPQGPIAACFLPVGERQEQMRAYSTKIGQVPAYLLDIPAAFERDAIYGDGDDDRRFILFARAVLGLMVHLRDAEGWPIEIVHINDWQPGLVPNYIKTYYHYTFGKIATVFTAHNLGTQGVFNPFTLYLSGLSGGGMVETSAGMTGSTFNFMARGMMFADIVTVASPTYSLEILTPAQGEGLSHLLQSRNDRLAGIVHGINNEHYDPETDPNIAAHYNATNITGKAICKAGLLQECGFELDASRPVIGVVGPLTEPKGTDLVLQALPWLLHDTNAQIVIAGTGQPYLEQALANQMKQNPNRIHVRLGTEKAFIQRVYAGCDAMLFPARHEPIGTSTLISLRYGSIPIVRAVGALNDSVREGYDGNGFRFYPYTVSDLNDAILRCLSSYADANGWKQLRSRGMREDHSWLATAREYVGIYDWAKREVSG